MPRMEEYHCLPPGITRHWWGTRMGKVLMPALTVLQPLRILAKGEPETTAALGQAEPVAKPEPQVQRTNAVAPAPRFDMVSVSYLTAIWPDICRGRGRVVA